MTPRPPTILWKGTATEEDNDLRDLRKLREPNIKAVATFIGDTHFLVLPKEAEGIANLASRFAENLLLEPRSFSVGVIGLAFSLLQLKCVSMITEPNKVIGQFELLARLRRKLVL